MSINKFALLDPDYDETLQYMPDLKLEEPSKGINEDALYNTTSQVELINDDSYSKVNNKKPYRKALSYDDKIKLISEYFGVSETCAKYLFHRRYRGYPFHKKNDSKYLAWSITLQNAIIILDTLVGFDWNTLEFGYEELVFNKYDINIEDIDDDPIRLVEETENTEWQEISNTHIIYELTKMGLLPKSYRECKSCK